MKNLILKCWNLSLFSFELFLFYLILLFVIKFILMTLDMYMTFFNSIQFLNLLFFFYLSLIHLILVLSFFTWNLRIMKNFTISTLLIKSFTKSFMNNFVSLKYRCITFTTADFHFLISIFYSFIYILFLSAKFKNYKENRTEEICNI